MAIKVATSGFGRTGRCVARIIAEHDDLELIAISDTTELELIKYPLKYGAVHGELDASVGLENGDLLINNRKAKMFHTCNINELDFAKYSAQLVFECIGAHLTREKCQAFLNRDIEKVLMPAPAKNNTPTFVMDVNSHLYKGEAIISNASCATNYLDPVCRVLQDNFDIEKDLVTAIYACTNGQGIVDTRAKDRRRSRATVQNTILAPTGAARAMKLVMPELDGKLHGQSIRVPVIDVSGVGLTALLSKKVSKEELSEAFRKASKTNSKGISAVDDRERVSSDFITSPFGAVVASDLAQVISEDFVKIVTWCSNEWGYFSRLVDMTIYVVGT